MTKRRDLSCEIADFFADTDYAKLPQDAIEGAKKSIVDTLGVCLAASGSEPAVRHVVEMVKAGAGAPEATILAFGGRVPAVMAAFANGAMAHCLDYDDQTPWGQHSASSLVPAVWAAAEKRGGVSGKTMIAAVAAGQDFFNRMRRYVDWRKDWSFTTVMGVFGAAAAASRILELPREQIANAIGIASLQSCGTAEVINATGSDLRAMYAGFPAKGGVLAASLAQVGISGVPNVFEGEFGVMRMYFANRYDRKEILNGLGEIYTGGLTLYKRWPAVGTAHSHIHATLGLMIDHGISAKQIEEIRISVGDYHQLMSMPIEKRRAPETLVDAKFSLPFLVALAAVRGDLRLTDFTDESIRDPAVLAMAQRVIPVPDPSLDWKIDLPDGRVQIVLRDGRVFERVGADVPGSATNPMSWDDIFRKFDDCAAAAINPWTDVQKQRLRDFVLNLENAGDATELLRIGAE